METPSIKNIFNVENVKKYSPFILLLFLTILLMLFFKSNKKGISGMIEEGKKNLLSLYTSGLRPLITETKISQEDLFNFALYQSLPLDQEKNKVLTLSDLNGQMVYEIKPANFNKSTRNYEAFKNYFGMNNNEMRISDSVLNSYRKEIYSYVLVNEKNAYAVNPRITSVRKAMLADLIYLAQKINKEKAEEIFPTLKGFGQNDLASLIKTERDFPTTHYLLMTPDTIAKTDFTLDEEKFSEQLKAFEAGKFAAEEFVKNQAFSWDGDVSPPKVPSTPQKPSYKFDYKIDSNKYKITFDAHSLSKMIDDSIRINLEKAAKELRSISVKLPSLKGKGSKSDLKVVPPIPDAIYDIIPNVAHITEGALKTVGRIDISRIIEEALQNDPGFQKMLKDSAKSKKFQEKMKELNKKFKKQSFDSLKHLQKNIGN